MPAQPLERAPDVLRESLPEADQAAGFVALTLVEAPEVPGRKFAEAYHKWFYANPKYSSADYGRDETGLVYIGTTIKH